LTVHEIYSVINEIFKGKIKMTDSVKYLLEESKAPKFWYNINADLPSPPPPPPPLHPGTKQPAGPDDFAPLFPMGLIMQEV
jgi:tryptophan synthase beta chain